MPDRDIIVAFTADEEAGGEAKASVGWFARIASLIDAGLVLNPDSGTARFQRGTARLLSASQTSEKVLRHLPAEITNKGGHSSVPGPTTPSTS